MTTKLDADQAIKASFDDVNQSIKVGGHIINPSASFQRPDNSTAYTSGDLVANNATAGSVVPMTLTVGRNDGGNVVIRRAKLLKSTSGLSGADFRVHLYRVAPTSAAGDNAAYSTDEAANYLGSIDVSVTQAFTDGAVGLSTQGLGPNLVVKLDSTTEVYALLEARGAYTPGAEEVFTLSLEILQG